MNAINGVANQIPVQGGHPIIYRKFINLDLQLISNFITTLLCRPQLFAHIRENAKKKNFYIDFINGYTDHVHILVSLNDDLSIGKIAQLIKGESSHWINQMQLTVSKFEWQDEYLAIGVGDDKLDIVRNYIAKQSEHHKNVSFATEYNKFVERYGLNMVTRNSVAQ
jgi:putative transposase